MADAQKSIELCDNRRLRAGAEVSYQEGDLTGVYTPTTKVRAGPFRFCAQIAPHAVVDSSNRLAKHPMCWIRKRESNAKLNIHMEPALKDADTQELREKSPNRLETSGHQDRPLSSIDVLGSVMGK